MNEDHDQEEWIQQLMALVPEHVRTPPQGIRSFGVEDDALHAASIGLAGPEARTLARKIYKHAERRHLRLVK